MTASLERLLTEFWERREAGDEVAIDAFVAAHPEGGDELRTALGRMLQVAGLLPDGDLPPRIGAYRVERRLGRGATGEVFAVTAPDGRPLALKRLLPHVAEVERARQRLTREAAVLRTLRHPGIVAVVDAGEDAAPGGLPFLVMERIDGAPLTAWLDEARTRGRDVACARLAGPGSPWQRLARLGAAIAEAIAAAHAAGVLHRDLKPGNVLLRRDGTPVVVDFGLAADDAAATLTGTGDVLGTPHYMAPEQARGEPATPATDVHAIGAVLHELLTLAPPRPGSDVVHVLDAARRHSPRPPRACCAEVPRELDLIVRRALAFRPRHRHADAATLAAALRLVADGGRPIGLTLGFGQRADEFWRRYRRAALVTAAAAVVLATALTLRSAWGEARAQRVRQATIAASEALLDDAADDVAPHAAALADDGAATLARVVSGQAGTDDPDPFARAIATGRAALQTDPAAAMRSFATALAQRPASGLAAGWLGIAAARSDDLPVAERELVSAVRALPASVRLRVELSRVLRHDPARYDDAVAHMRHAVTLPRADADTWHEFAKALARSQRPDEALVAVDTALAQASGTARHAMLRTKAILLDGLRRYDEAIPLLRTLLDEAPTTDTWVSYGAILDAAHRFDEAVAAYREALARSPAHTPALLNLVYLHSGSKRATCDACRQAFEQDPQLLDAARADAYATRLLEAQEGSFELAEVSAGYVRRVGDAPCLLAAIEQRLVQDLPATPLGRLLRARRVLRAP